MHRARMRGSRSGVEGVLNRIKLRGTKHASPNQHDIKPAPQALIDSLNSALAEEEKKSAERHHRRLSFPANIYPAYIWEIGLISRRGTQL